MDICNRIIIFIAMTCCIIFLMTPELYAQTNTENKKWPPRNYLVYYGEWNEAKADRAGEFDLVILHPGPELGNISPSLIKNIRNGKDEKEDTEDDTIVIAYISIGEEEAVPRGPAYTKDKGPVYFDGHIIEGNNDYPARYLDEVSYIFDDSGFISCLPGGVPAIVSGHDGLPDENGKWGSFYVNPGDPEWQGILIERMKELSNDYEVDGFFLDTLDTASPWGNYGWTQENMVLFIKKIRDLFPHKFLIANRGLFLLESYGELFGSSIDGLMFESFLTEWDWYEKKGVESPYLSDNYRILKESVIPASQVPGGFHIFFLDYMNPEQNDFYNLLAFQKDFLKELHYTDYIASPDLQQIFPPPDRYFSDEEYILPEISDLEIEETGRGGFLIAFELRGIEDNKLLPGKDFFIDIRYGEIDNLPALKPLEIDYKLLDDNNISIESFGLDKDRDYIFYLRLVTKNPSVPVGYIKYTLHTRKGTYPGLIGGIKGEGRDSSLYLSWDRGENLSSYNIYFGPNKDSMKKIKTLREENFLVEGLENNRAYCFSISGNSPEGEEGCLSYPITLYPKYFNPPPSPENLEAVYDRVNKKLHLSWSPVVCEDLAGYMVYCFLSEKGLRLPVVFNSSVLETSFNELKPGIYTLFVTSFDHNRNQGPPCDRKEIFIPISE